MLTQWADDIAGRSDTSRTSLRLLYEATSPELAYLIEGLAPAAQVDDILAATYLQAWSTASHRPATVPVFTWLMAIAVGVARRSDPRPVERPEQAAQLEMREPARVRMRRRYSAAEDQPRLRKQQSAE